MSGFVLPFALTCLASLLLPAVLLSGFWVDSIVWLWWWPLSILLPRLPVATHIRRLPLLTVCPEDDQYRARRVWRGRGNCQPASPSSNDQQLVSQTACLGHGLGGILV
ncbi:hypothetical protein CGRA01v4_00877 [Colletotrichum graminicola]|nr:hypothetical protein CGRA01v4_00877 [Colletotrichum graminicola]